MASRALVDKVDGLISCTLDPKEVKIKIRGDNSRKCIAIPSKDVDPTDITEVYMSYDGNYLQSVSLENGFCAFKLWNDDSANKDRWLCAELTRVTNPGNETGTIKVVQEKIDSLRRQLSINIALHTENKLCLDLTEIIVGFLYGKEAPDVYLLPEGAPISDHCKFKIIPQKSSAVRNVGIQTADEMYLRSPYWSDKVLQQTHCHGDEYFSIITTW